MATWFIDSKKGTVHLLEYIYYNLLIKAAKACDAAKCFYRLHYCVVKLYGDNNKSLFSSKL